VNHALIRRQH